MRIRKVPPYIITRAMIEAHKAGIKTLTRDELEAHYLAGGHVEKVVHALVSASKANIDLPFQMATAIDLAGRDVFEAVQMSVNPKVIDTITYVELRELAYMGATVLHEEAIFPVRQEGIPINIRNTNRPQDPGTLIVESTCRKTALYDHRYCRKERICSHQHRKRYDELRNRILPQSPDRIRRQWYLHRAYAFRNRYHDGIRTSVRIRRDRAEGTGRYPPCCQSGFCQSGI